MRNLILIFIFLVSNASFGQDFNGVLEYEHTFNNNGITNKTIPNDLLLIDGLVHIFQWTFNHNRRYSIFENKIITTVFVPEFEQPIATFFQKKENFQKVNLISGEIEKNRTASKIYLGLNIPLRKKRGTTFINNMECLKYQGRSDKGWEVELWVAKDKIGLNDKGLNSEFIYKNHLVVKRIHRNKKKNLEHILTLKSISKINGNAFTKELHDLKNTKNKTKNNPHLINKSIAVGDSLSNFQYLDLYKNELVDISQFKGDSLFLVIDIWGTWCQSCLEAMPLLKSLQYAYPDQIEILSLAYKEPSMERLKNKIDEKQMDWNNGYASERINKYLNPEKFFPEIILLDDEMNVLFIGNPLKQMDELEAFLRKSRN